MSQPLQHIAVIMDGNGRWAAQKNYPRLTGHQAGAKNALDIVEACVLRNIKILTLFAFSVENWYRPITEVKNLLNLFDKSLEDSLTKILDWNVRVQIIGDFERLSTERYKKIKHIESLTEKNTGLLVVIALSYGGQWDIVQATQQLANRVFQGELKVEEITTKSFSEELQLSNVPAPDLCIRTGGEYRISNFLLWHLAYSELYFTPTLWPDFDASALDKAIVAYSCRNRRFGILNENKL